MRLKHNGFMILSISIMFVFGCTYGTLFVLPEQVKKVAIPAFTNKTVYYGIEERLTNMVIEEFLQDGRLEITNKKEADAYLEGEVSAYFLQPLSFDEENRVKEYELEITVVLVLKDLSNEQILWEKNLTQFTRYFPLSDSSEEEAKIMVLKYMVSDIVREIAGGR